MSLERTIPATDLTGLEVQLRRGNVTIEEGDPSVVVLVADLGNGVSEADLRIDVENGVLRIIQAPSPHTGGSWGGLNIFDDLGIGSITAQFGRIDLRLALPASLARAAVTTGLGQIAVSQWHGELDVRTGKGDVNLGKGAGRVSAASGMGGVTIAGFSERCQVQTGMGDVAVVGGHGRAEVRTGLGRVRIADAELDLEAHTGKGDLVLDHVSGRAKLATGLGMITVAGAEDLAVEAKSGKGNIELKGTFRAIEAESGFGAITGRIENLRGTADLATGHGEIDFGFASDLVVRFDIATRRGQVTSDVPLVQVGKPGPEGFFSQRFVGTFGAGDVDATVRLRSGHGAIHLQQLPPRSAGADVPSVPTEASPRPAQPETPVEAPPEPAKPEAVSPPPVSPDDQRLKVLEALSRGDISVEEAERRLSAV